MPLWTDYLLQFLVAIVATILPPFVIISVISVFYAAFRDNFLVSQMLEGMQAGVGAVIASVVWEMGSDVVKSKNPFSIAIMAGAFAATCFFGVNVVIVVLVCALLGVVRTLLHRKEGAAK